ncbi:DMT family transporter [Azohydromonas lata]|uniref:DMT family transporter n=1 Tax=Azohydromonas lata TaxID=45677 RepID=A0ABU5ILM5_9BURK|nr:DMT family transporter [Azohydromonas lata]MDZ5459766.1 DMT family transporter [Azohydromonas lata]
MERTTRGWLNGLAGVVIFSGSLPATRLAVGAFDPVFLTGARAVLAALLGGALLLAWRQRRPAGQDLVPLALVALGCVVAFPLLTALALQHITSAHAMVFIGALPLATAVFAVLRGGERPRRAFWLFSMLGSGLIAGYALVQGVDAAPVGDALMLAAIVACGLGYAEGARLTARLGGWQVISWALVLSLPVMLPLAWLTAPASLEGIQAPAWLGLGYVSVFSMLVGFVFWYRGLAQGGVAAVSQLQLLQPFFGLTLAALLLHEQVTWLMQVAAVAVIGCVAGARRFAR